MSTKKNLILPVYQIPRETLTRLKDVAEKTIESYLNKLPDKITKQLDKILMQYLGIKISYGAFEITKDSILYKALELKARPVIDKIINNIKWAPTEEEMQDILKQGQHVYITRIKEQIRYKLGREADKLIDQFLHENLNVAIELEEETKNLEPLKVPTEKEAANPAYGQTDIQKLLLELKLEQGKK